MRVIPTIPLKEMSLKTVLCCFNSGAMRRANQTMPRTQREVATDSITLSAVADLESLNLRGQRTAPRIQFARLRASLMGRIWKTMTQIIWSKNESVNQSVGCAVEEREIDDRDLSRLTLNQRKLPLSCLGLFLRTPWRWRFMKNSSRWVSCGAT